MKVFEEIVLLKTRFHKVDVQQLIEYIVEAAKIGDKAIVGNVNIKAMNLAWELPWYQDFLNKANLVFCDGFGALLGAKIFGYALTSEHRMTPPDFIERPFAVPSVNLPKSSVILPSPKKRSSPKKRVYQDQIEDEVRN